MDLDVLELFPYDIKFAFFSSCCWCIFTDQVVQ